MRFIKRIILKMLQQKGYELRKGKQDPYRFENFVNLALAYELRLVQNGSKVEQNPKRASILGRLLGTPPSEAYSIVEGLAESKMLPGDVCEFGVAQGETSALIATEIEASGKILHLFDSFEGLPVPSHQDKLKDDIFNLGSMEAYAGTMSCPEDMVRGRLEEIQFPQDRFVIHKGFVDQVFATAKNLPTKVSFAYVDFDFYEPILITLRFLHGVTAPGAVVVVDDYDFFSTGAKQAVDEFVSQMNAQQRTYEIKVPDPKLGYFAVLKRLL